MRIAKAVAAAVGTLATVLVAALGDDVLAMSEIAQIVTTLVTGGLTVYAVYKVSNAPAATPKP